MYQNHTSSFAGKRKNCLKIINSKIIIMVRIVNYLKRTTDEGKDFFILEIQGGVEMVKSKETGKFYVTARKASIASTFDELTCKALIGTEMPGNVVKVECEPFEYMIKDTGEFITLHHRFEYSDEEKAINTNTKVEKSNATVEDFIGSSKAMELENSFSENGHLQHS
jgi:hypothetical protein